MSVLRVSVQYSTMTKNANFENLMNKVILQNATKTKSIPSKKQFAKWINVGLSRYKKKHEVVIRLVSINEITKLNQRYRKKNKPTNIISFPFEPPRGIKHELLGDLVICLPIVKKEAKTQGKTVLAHLAHLTIHGVLHLLGHDHKTDKQATKMEALEIRYLKRLGFPNPYIVY